MQRAQSRRRAVFGKVALIKFGLLARIYGKLKRLRDERLQVALGEISLLNTPLPDRHARWDMLEHAIQ